MSRLVDSNAARAAGALALALAIGAVACSGSDPTGVGDAPSASNAADGGGSDAASSSNGKDASSSVPPTTSDSGVTTDGGATGEGGANCVPQGYAGNDKKIGAYCDDKVSCPFQIDPFLICTAGHDPTGTHQFCTTPCSKDSECGSGAYCVHDTSGSGCVPTQCGGAPGS